LYQAFPSDPTFLTYIVISVLVSTWNSCPATEVKKPKLPFVANVTVSGAPEALTVNVSE
jgi:hypothetical protein